MGRNHPLEFGVDSNGMMSRELDDHINSKIYSMMGTCTNEEMLKYELAITHKSVLLLQNEIADLKGKLEALVSKHKNEVDELQSQLEMQTIKYKKAKDEACLNARALKRCIADHQQLREEIQRDMPAESSVEQGNQMQEFREEMEISTPTALSPKQRWQPMDELRPVKYPKYQLSQDTHKFSGNHMRNIYVDCMRTIELVHGTSEGHEDETCLNGRALKRCIADHQQLREEIQRDMPGESSVEQGNQEMHEFRDETQTSIPTELSPIKKCQMQEFREEMEISMPTELSPKQRCQPMDELRPIKYPKYQLSQDTHKFSGNNMRNIYVDCMRTMKLVHGTSEGHEDGERQYKWVDGRQSNKKRLLQDLDPNIDDLGYRLSMPEDADEV